MIMNKTPTKAKSLEQSQTGSGTQQQKIFSSFIVYFLYFFFRHCLQVKFVLDSSSSSKVPRLTQAERGASVCKYRMISIQLIDISSPSRTTHFRADKIHKIHSTKKDVDKAQWIHLERGKDVDKAQ